VVKKHKVQIPVIASSGNLFADLGLPEPEEELTKEQLASHIWQTSSPARRTNGRC
jgi:hypothetical protein